MYFAGRGNRTYESLEGSSGIKAASSLLLLGRLVGLLSCSHIKSCCVWGAYLLSTRRSEGALDPTNPEMRGEGGWRHISGSHQHECGIWGQRNDEIMWDSGFQSVVHGRTVVVIAPGDLLEIQIFKLLPRLTESEIWGVEPSDVSFIKPSRKFWYKLTLSVEGWV